MYEIPTFDARDFIYLLFGLGLMAMSAGPVFERIRGFNLPLIFIVIGALVWPLGLPVLNPLEGELQAKIVEHAAELIVIVSLAGAGLAIDLPESWRNWQPTWRLLMICMPLTIVAVAVLGVWGLGLSLASAVLLAGALAPTDPVLARSVQVAGPGEDEEPMEIALTAEAGLNDGLAFPFIWLAILMAEAGGALTASGWFDWLSFDVLYRIAAGLIVGRLVGALLSRFVMSRWGDAELGARNAALVVLGATFLAYGTTEAVDGYGFLAVFMATRAGRAHTRGTEQETYEKHVHQAADQFESVLLVLLLLWFGSFAISGALDGLRWQEVAFALALILLIRPAAALLSLAWLKCDDLSRFKTAFFGIRGMGSVFYIAYGQNHAEFGDLDAVWRIATVTILLSILIHGTTASILMPREAGLPPGRPKSDP